MNVQVLELGAVMTNCYIVSQEKTKEAIIIDPADNANAIKKYLESEQLIVKGILLTHGHFDHIMAAKELALAYHIDIYASLAEEDLLNNPVLNCSIQFGNPYTIIADKQLRDNEEFSMAGFSIKVLSTPGHTIGSVCYYFPEEKALFSGDTLFQESIGRTDLPTGDEKKIIESIQQKILPLANDIVVFPGHGGKTTIAYEKENNYFLR